MNQEKNYTESPEVETGESLADFRARQWGTHHAIHNEIEALSTSRLEDRESESCEDNENGMDEYHSEVTWHSINYRF